MAMPPASYDLVTDWLAFRPQPVDLRSRGRWIALGQKLIQRVALAPRWLGGNAVTRLQIRRHLILPAHHGACPSSNPGDSSINLGPSVHNSTQRIGFSG